MACQQVYEEFVAANKKMETSRTNRDEQAAITVDATQAAADEQARLDEAEIKLDADAKAAADAYSAYAECVSGPPVPPVAGQLPSRR